MTNTLGKIVFVHLWDDFSGSPRVLSDVITACECKNVQCDVFVGDGSTGFLAKKHDDIKTYFYRRSDSQLVTFFFLMTSQICLFFRVLTYWRDDVTFYVNTMLPFGGAIAARLMGKKVIYHIHETSIRPKFFKSFLRYVIRFTAVKIVYVSEYLRTSEPFSNIKNFVVYNAVSNVGSHEVIGIRPQVKAFNHFHVLMACSLRDYKGVQEFLQVAWILKGDHYPTIKFVLVLNATTDQVSGYFSNFDIPDNVELYSSQKDMKKFYLRANLLLNLSRVDSWIETFGLTIVEAMSYGVPVIVPPIGGPAEIVRAEIDGYLIDSRDYAEIANVIERISSDQEHWRYLSHNARERSQYFGVDKFCEGIHHVVFEDEND